MQKRESSRRGRRLRHAGARVPGMFRARVHRPAMRRTRAETSSPSTGWELPLSISAKRRRASCFHAVSTPSGMPCCNFSVRLSTNSATLAGGQRPASSTICSTVKGMAQTYVVPGLILMLLPELALKLPRASGPAGRASRPCYPETRKYVGYAFKPSGIMGMERRRMRVASKMALPTAGAMAMMGDSPAPAEGRSLLSRRTISILGMSAKRGTR